MVLLALTTTAPWAGWVAPVTLSGSPSGSLSLARTLTVTGVSSAVAVEAFTASGGRFWLPCGVIVTDQAGGQPSLEGPDHGRSVISNSQVPNASCPFRADKDDSGW